MFLLEAHLFDERAFYWYRVIIDIDGLKTNPAFRGGGGALFIGQIMLPPGIQTHALYKKSSHPKRVATSYKRTQFLRTSFKHFAHIINHTFYTSTTYFNSGFCMTCSESAQ